MKKCKSLCEQLMLNHWQIKALNILFDAAKAANYQTPDSEFGRQVSYIRKVLEIGEYAKTTKTADEKKETVS